MSLEAPRYGEIDVEYAVRLGSTPAEEDGPVWMVNLMKYRDKADYLDGRPDDISGREADDRYFPIESLTAVGAEVVFAGEVEDQLLGDEPTWDRVGVVKYPTRRSFMDMQTRPDFIEKHVHKDAGMEQTFVIGTEPMPHPTAPDSVAPVEWSDVPHPPTDEDGEVVVIHVLRFNEGAAEMTPEDMTAYSDAAARTAVPHGVRIDGWFAVDGTIVGDGRGWDQVRFNRFPSKAAFMAVVTDPDRLEAQKNHREVAIADTYTMILRPMINELAASVDG